jgi:F0F1-type ATP synthase membrane subunit b/b'
MPTDKLFEYFLGQGILGAMVVVNIIVIIYLWKRLEKIQDELQARIEDFAAQILSRQLEHAKEIRTLQDEKLKMMQEHLTTILKIKDEVTDVTHKVTATMEALIVGMTRGK